MLILPAQIPAPTPVQGAVSPLNTVWVGSLDQRPLALPQAGHLLFAFPVSETAIACSGTTVDAGRYILLTRSPEEGAFTIEAPALPASNRLNAQVLVLWVSPPFVADIARFLNISSEVRQLLHGVPLLQGDPASALLSELAVAVEKQKQSAPAAAPAAIEELFLEVVGELLRMMRLRHQALMALARHKRSTVADLLPRLLQARQFIEARYTEPFTTQDLANYVALSEFHFSRLFRAAFDIAVRQYVIRLRLDEARRMLEMPGASVTETALHVGYSSLSSFIHAFTRKFGTTPARYQAQRKSAQLSTSHPTDDVL